VRYALKTWDKLPAHARPNLNPDDLPQIPKLLDGNDAAVAAFTILWHAKTPMHYRHIAEQARHKVPRSTIKSQLYNPRFKDVFIKVDEGTFGLVLWQSKNGERVAMPPDLAEAGYDPDDIERLRGVAGGGAHG
jgi:hypothetical protein